MANPIDVFFVFDDDTKEIVGKYATRAEAVTAAGATGISLLDKGIKSVQDAEGAAKDAAFVQVNSNWHVFPDQTIKHQPLSIDAASLRQEALDHARDCLDLLPLQLIVDGRGRLKNQQQTRDAATRWPMTRAWIIGPLAVIDALIKANRASDAVSALRAYQILVPADRSSIVRFFRSLNLANWRRNVGLARAQSNNAQASFDWQLGEDPHAKRYGQDFAGGVVWNGTGDTIDVKYPRDNDPEDFAS